MVTAFRLDVCVAVVVIRIVASRRTALVSELCPVCGLGGRVFAVFRLAGSFFLGVRGVLTNSSTRHCREFCKVRERG